MKCIMWCALFLVSFLAAASGEHFQAWKTDTEYVYLVRGRTLAALHDVDDQYTGIILKAMLTVQPKGEDTLQARISKAQYAQIHTKLLDGWKSEIPDRMVEYKQLPLSDKVFEVKMKHGTIRDLIVDKEVPTWEVNILKSIVGQLQVDTQGENLMPSKHNHVPEENDVNAMYKTMEDSVGGRCEVMYTISPLPEYSLRERFEWAEKLESQSKEEAIDIIKTKNYTNCEQRMSDSFGISGHSGKELYPKEDSEFMARTSISRIIITGDLKTFTIRSSVTTDQLILSPSFYENHKGMVSSRVNVTLVKMGPVSSGPWSTPANPESTGNLVYNYNNPFAVPNEGRRPGSAYSDSDDLNSEERVRYPSDRSWEDDSVRLSNDVDSLESNEQQKSYLQPKPTLNEAPSMPLLPFFIGNHGRSVQKSPDVDSIATVKTLARQIGNDLQNPTTIIDEQTLEKFSILVRVLRTMSTQQIAEAQRELYVSSNVMDPHDESQSVRGSTWVAFRDAIAQVGTGPALITIKNLIKEKKMQGIEAAMVVSVLSKTARTPTPEYVDAFFNMVTMPETTEQEFLNSTAMVSFAELVRYSQVNANSAHNRYPVHSFGRLSPKHNPAVSRVFIPYMAEQLKKAIDNREPAKSHVYIRALGTVAHPQILAVYEPYLEGKIKASTFQRLLMVMSMNKLASLKPELARGVLYKIYQNTAETHQLRCAAVTLIISTNPPMSMLQRMAEFTHHDISKQVNAAVKSAIETASELTERESQQLASKARNILPLLNKDNYGFEYSKNYLFDYGEDAENFATRLHVAQIGSEDSFIPQALYARMNTMYGDYEVPQTDIGAMVSSVKHLYDVWRWQYGDAEELKGQQDSTEYSAEKIAKMLKLESQKTDRFEGVMWFNNIYDNKFLSFDKNSLLRIPHLMKKACALLKNGQNFNIARINNYEMTLSFPMESGLPFLYTFDMPNAIKLSGSIKGNSNLPKTVEGSLDIRVLHATQIRARLGFITPFDHQQYIAGLNQDYQIHLPIHAKMLYDNTQNQASLTLEPINKNEEFQVMAMRMTPFTANHDIFNMSPVMKDKKTHVLVRGEVWEKPNTVRALSNGFAFKYVVELDTNSKSKQTKDDWKENFLLRFALGLGEGKIDYRKTELYVIPHPSSSQSITLTASLETLQSDSMKHGVKKSANLNARVLKIKSKMLNDPERRKQMLKDVSQGIVAADGVAVDLGVELPGQEPLQLITTLAYANSMIDEKSRAQMFMRLNIEGFSKETCVALESESPKVSPLDMSMARKEPKISSKFDIEFRAGDTCETGNKILINGIQEQSGEYRKAVRELPYATTCRKEMLEGSKSTVACQKFNEKLSIMDQAKVNIEFEPEDRMLEVFKALLEMTGSLDNAILTRDHLTGLSDNKLELAMSLFPFDDTATFSYMSPETTIYFHEVDMGPLGGYIGNADPELSMTERLNLKLNDISSSHHTCIMDPNTATTFDQATYPISLGQCWHVALTTNPTNNEVLMESPWRKKDWKNEKISVLVRDTDNKKKEVKMTLGNAVLELKVLDDKAFMSVDGNRMDLMQNPKYVHKVDGEIDFMVVLRSDDSIRVVSSKYGVDVVYTGQELRVKMSGDYRSNIRGLCGNYDGEPDNDFTNPKNCISKKVDQFVASYALSSKNCQGPSRELSQSAKMNEAECERRIIRPANVISNREAGRKNPTKNSWGFHNQENSRSMNEHKANNRCITGRTRIIEEADQTCFTLRPVPACSSGCQVVRSKPKVMPMHCIRNGPTANAIAERINKGANPDFSQKEVSKKLAFDMPVVCQAA